MTFLDIFSEHLRELGLKLRVNKRLNYITFSAGNVKDHFRLQKRDDIVTLISVKLVSRQKGGETFFIPRRSTILKVSIHDPDGIETICNWLKDLKK